MIFQFSSLKAASEDFEYTEAHKSVKWTAFTILEKSNHAFWTLKALGTIHTERVFEVEKWQAQVSGMKKIEKRLTSFNLSSSMFL